MKNKKEVYGFRKSKVAKTLCGAVLGTALIAFADKAVPKTAPHNVFATLLLRNP